MLKILEEMVFDTAPVVMVAYHGIEIEALGAGEDVAIDIGANLSELLHQPFHLLTFGTILSVVLHIFLRHLTGTSDKMQPIIFRPSDDILLLYEIQRADQLHTRKVCAVDAGHHRAEFPRIKHTHEDSFHYIVKMMAQSDLVAAEGLSSFIKEAASHLGTHIAGCTAHGIHCIKDIRFKHADGDLEFLRILLHPGAVFRIVAGIHHEEFQLKVGFPAAL